MNLKNELDIFYESMFKKEKNKLINLIITKIIESFSNMSCFSIDEVTSYIYNIANIEIIEFNKGVDNISCKWIFEKFKDEMEKEIFNICQKLKDFYITKKHDYLLDREQHKVNENIYETVTRENIVQVKSHGTFIEKYKCCGATNKNALGCTTLSLEEEAKRIDEEIRKHGILGGLGKLNLEPKHIRDYNSYCVNCGGTQESKECTDVYKNFGVITEEILKDVKQNYTMDEWNDNNFKIDASKFLNDILKKLN